MKIKKCREIRKNNTEGCFGLSPFSLIWAPPRACCARSFTYLLLCLTWQSYPEGTTPHTSSSVWSVDCFCVCLCVCACVCVCVHALAGLKDRVACVWISVLKEALTQRGKYDIPASDHLAEEATDQERWGPCTKRKTNGNIEYVRKVTAGASGDSGWARRKRNTQVKSDRAWERESMRERAWETEKERDRARERMRTRARECDSVCRGRESERRVR